MESSKNPARMSLSFVMPLFTASVFTVPSHIAFYAVSVRQTRGLSVVSLFPHPVSFGSRLTTDTLAFGYLLPAAGRIRVFHPLETCAAGRMATSTSPSHFHPRCFGPGNSYSRGPCPLLAISDAPPACIRHRRRVDGNLSKYNVRTHMKTGRER